jgi:hypothetical protein
MLNTERVGRAATYCMRSLVFIMSAFCAEKILAFAEKNTHNDRIICGERM